MLISLDKGRPSRGFTLIELLVAIAIIAILAAIAIPQFIAYRQRAVDDQMRSDLKNAATAMESYFAEKQVYPTTVAAIEATGFNRTDGVNLNITVSSPSAFTLTASKPGGTQASFTYNSTTGIIQ